MDQVSLIPRPNTDAENQPGIDCSCMCEIIDVAHRYFTVYYCDVICRLQRKYAMKYQCEL